MRTDDRQSTCTAILKRKRELLRRLREEREILPPHTSATVRAAIDERIAMLDLQISRGIPVQNTPVGGQGIPSEGSVIVPPMYV